MMKCNKGFTLVEMVVVITLLLSVIAVVLILFLYGNRTYSSEINHYENQSDVRFVLDYISSHIRNATKLEITSAPTITAINSDTDHNNYIFFQNGKIQTYFYNGGSYEYKQFGDNIDDTASFFKKAGSFDDILKISTKAMVNGSEGYEASIDIKLINFKLSSPREKILGDTQNKAIKFKLPNP